MNKIKIFQVDTFCNELFSGNAAAVCPLNDWLPDEIMQSIAIENNLSETAFFIKKNDNIQIRWFTPKVEIDLCGHATLAAAHIVYSEMGFSGKQLKFITKSGEILKVIKNGNIINMNFPSYSPKVVDHNLENLSRILKKYPTSLLHCKYTTAIYENEKEIIEINPDFSALEKLPYKGLIVTAPGETVDFVSRFFAPKLGIQEDPVTGSAYCELIPYWAKRLKKNNMISKQLSRREGKLYCSYLGDRVIIGGQAVTYMRGNLLLNI